VSKLLKDENPQVISLDLYLAAPSGLATLQKLRQEGYTGKTVVLAGPSARSSLGDAFQIGVDQLIGSIEATEGLPDPAQVESAIRNCFRDTIARRARQLWDEAGQPAGKDLRFWLKAEHEILGQAGERADDA
jgi:DNA-binding NarL/FixJ family response regulator